MQLRSDALAAHLAKGLASVYVLHGGEPLLTQEAADAIRAAARAHGFDERHLHVVSGAHFDWSAVQADAQAQSLFAARQVIDLRIPSGKPGKEGAAALQHLAQVASPEMVLLVTLPRLDRQQQQSAWFTALDAAGVSVRLDPVERHQLPQWLAQRLAAQGQPVAPGEAGAQALSFFADRVEGNLLAAHQELQKLALLHPPGPLTQAQIEAAVLNVARYDVFKLGEAVLGGDLPRALRMLRGLEAEGEAAVLVHWALAEDIRALHRIQRALAAGTPLPMALREARVWGPKERLLERIAPRLLGAPSLAGLVRDAQICDALVKGLRHPDWPQEPWRALQELVSRLVATLAAPPTSRRSR